jgi:dihydrodipicolinate synthase/N-acetylneuraminate lyase
MPLTSAELIEDPIGRYPDATVACFDPTCAELPRRQLDEARTVAFLERLAAVGVPAALIASSTGQGHLRTVEELEAWFRCAAQANVQEMLLMALLRPEDGAQANARLLDLLADTAYPVVFLRPGTDLPAGASDEQVSESLAPLVAAAASRGLAIGLYSISDVSGLPLTPDAAARLVVSDGGDHIVAVKITETDYEQSTARFLAHPALRHLKIVQGWDPHLGRALRDGPRFDANGRQRAGITSGLMSLAVYQYLHILKAVADEAWDELAEAQRAATVLFQAMQDDPRHFADLQRAKYIMGLGHPLTATVTQAQVERIFTALEGLPRDADRHRLARSLDLMEDGPFHDRLVSLVSEQAETKRT